MQRFFTIARLDFTAAMSFQSVALSTISDANDGEAQNKKARSTPAGDIRALDLKPLASGLLFFYDMISIFLLTPASKGMIT